ncbi:MAG TPA: hypothetical protein VFB33_03420 [Candidatus Binataceae bacterium]|jgi:hypothetical protein|nr:hypothetical protein [Candidatus Binataceae bacterium]
MKKITSRTTLALFPALAALTLGACFYGGPRPYYAYGPGYTAPPVYAAAPLYSAPPVYAYQTVRPGYGDWDDHHVWHDRDWWLDNNRPWVQEHHPQWLSKHQQERHDRDGDHDHH